MLVDDEIRKCVVFVGYQMANGDMRVAGSGFYLGETGDETRAGKVFLVTAKHVIDHIRALGLTETYIRYNTTDRKAKWAMVRSEVPWFGHPTDPTIDVVVLHTSVPPEWDHLVLPLSMAITEESIRAQSIGLGDEVFIVGLFSNHYGKQRNIPIVRVGNLAAMVEEKVQAKGFGLIDAYLIEARSIGGLSGSPVFVNLGLVRSINGEMKFATGKPILYLLGLVHGHYDVAEPSHAGAPAETDALTSDNVNTGIAIIVPISKVKEVIDAYPVIATNSLRNPTNGN